MRYVSILRTSVRRSTFVNYYLTNYFKTYIHPVANVSSVFLPAAHVRLYATEYDSATTANDGNNRNNQLFERFEELLCSSTFDESSWSALSAEFGERIPAFRDDEIRTLIDHIRSFSQKFSIHFHQDETLHQLTRILDDTMEKRAPSWDTDEFLIFFQYFSYLPQLRNSEFSYYVVKKRLRRIIKEDKAKVIKFLHLMNKCDLWRIYYIPKFRLETFLDRNVFNLSPDELSILLKSMTETRLTINTPKLMERLICKIINDLDLINDGRLLSILTFLKFQLKNWKFNPIPIVDHLVFTAQTYNFDLKYLICIAELCVKTMYYDTDFFQILCRTFVQNLTNNVTLDQTKTTLSCLTFFDSTSQFVYAYEALVNRLQESSYLNQLLLHPKALIFIVSHLCTVGVYPYDLLDIIFSESFLHSVRGKQQSITLLKYHEVGKQLLFMDSSLPFENPDYRDNRLKPEVSQTLMEYYYRNLPALLRTKQDDENFKLIYQRAHANTRLTYDVRLILIELLGGEEFIHTCYLLPYTPRPNILFAMNEQHVQQRIPSEITEVRIVDPRSLDKRLSWYTFLGCYLNTVDAEPILIKDEITKARYLKKSGVNIIRIVSEIWKNWSSDERRNYLKSKIFSKIENNLHD